MSDTLTAIPCWLNASPKAENATLWLKPISGDSPVTESIFVNLPSKASALRLADRIRATYGTHSYSMLLDLGSVRRNAKSGSLSISVDFATLKAAITVSEKQAQPEATPEEDDFFASLPAPTGYVAPAAAEDEDFF